MTKVRGSLFDRYRAHHEPDRPLLQWIGVLGVVAFPALYALRRATTGGGYDDLWWRLPAVALCLGLALRRWWPAALRPYYIAYSWWVVFYCLSFLMSYTMLRNGGGTPFVVNMVMCAVLIVLVADWRNSVTILLLGYVVALGLYFGFEPDPRVPSDFVFAVAGSALLVAGGALSHQGQKRVELERMRRVYIGLAGSVAHEMRTPLSQVRHALDNITRALGDPPGATTASRMQPVFDNVQLGHEAIARGLQSIEIALKQLQPEVLDQNHLQTLSASAVVCRAVDRFAYDAASHRQRVQVVVTKDFSLRADPTALEMVFFNLLKNALYYLPLQPDMTVRLTVTTEPAPCIVVRDTGPGIDPAFVPHLFEEFQTLGKAEGTGLGLFFCRRVMRAIGGDITCRSEWGRFTEFTLNFPPGPVQLDAPLVAAASPVPSLAGRTVLVVDDQPLNRAIAHALLTDLGLVAREAEHGQQALDVLQRDPLPDVILMDINMPGLDGIQATRLLRALPGAAGRVPVVALTANDSPAVRARAREVGMQGVLAKPIDPSALLQALSAAIDGHLSDATPPAPPPGAALLNTARIEDFRRLGLLEELLPRALSDLRRHLQTLEAAASAGEPQAVQAALHALVGLAGEAGAQALHALARARYAAWLEGDRPADPAWTRELSGLLDATEQALRQYGGLRDDAPTPPA